MELSLFEMCVLVVPTVINVSLLFYLTISSFKQNKICDRSLKTTEKVEHHLEEISRQRHKNETPVNTARTMWSQ